jgi:hypothetical protein
LDEDIQHGTMLIDGAPEIVGLPVDLNEDFIHMPCVAWACTPPSQFIGIVLAELHPGGTRPLPHGFIGDLHAARRQKFLNIPITEREAKIEPDGMAHNFSGKAITPVCG